MSNAGITRLAVWLVVLGALATSIATGASDAGAGDTGGTISLQGTPIIGQQGKIVLAFATAEGGGPQLARACWPVDSNLFGAPYMEMSEVPAGNPCGDATPSVNFPAGVYDITVGLYQGGQQTPDKQVTLQIDVNGNEIPTFDGIELSKEPAGDGNCDGLVNGADVLGSLGWLGGVGPEPACLDAANVICTDELNTQDVLTTLISQATGSAPMVPGGCPQLLAAPTLISPADGTVFDVFPRETPVDWTDVAGAASYVLQTDILESCPPYTTWCSDLGWGLDVYIPITDSEHEFNFVARGTGRWRVAAVGAEGRLGPFSEWRTFEHLQ